MYIAFVANTCLFYFLTIQGFRKIFSRAPSPPTYTYTHCKQRHRSLTTRTFQHPNTHTTQPCPLPPTHTVNKHTVHSQPERFNIPTLTAPSRAPSPLHTVNKHTVHSQPESSNIPTPTPPTLHLYLLFYTFHTVHIAHVQLTC